MKHPLRAMGFLAFWLVILLVLGSYYLLLAPRDSGYSEEENRTLAGFPAFSAGSLFSGEFTQSFEQYLLDRFPGRNTVISATSQLQSLLSLASHQEYLLIAEGPEDLLDTEVDEEALDALLDQLESPDPTAGSTLPPEEDPQQQTQATQATQAAPAVEDFPATLGVYMDRGKGESRVTEYSRKRVAATTAVLNKFAQLLPEDGILSFTVVPQSTIGNRFVNAAEQVCFYATWDDVVNGLGDDNVFAVDSAELLGQAITRDEYVYFRTDMHWTPYGSYLVYCEMIRQAGKEPCSYTEDFTLTVETPFRGTYYRDNPTAYRSVEADTLELLMPKVALQWRRITGPDSYELIDFLDFDAKKNDRYTVYLGGPAGPWTYAACENAETENCLVITDSFGLGFIPFLTANYGQVHYYDPRFFEEAAVGYSVAEMIESCNIQDIYVVVGDLHSFQSGFLVTTANSQLGTD